MNMMRNFLIFLSVILLSAASFAGNGSPIYIHAYGYGPVKIGMTPQKASLLLGVPLVNEGEPVVEGCYYVYPDGDSSSMGYMVQDEEIVRIDVWDQSIRTLSGLSVGSKEEEIQSRFKSKVKIEEHPYLGIGGHYVTVNVYGGNLLLFETGAQKVYPLQEGELRSEDFRVSRFRIGKPSAVSLIEGCL